MQDFEVDVFQDRGVAGLQFNSGSKAGFLRFQPASQADTPEITFLEAREAKLRSGGNQIIALVFGKLEERVGHLGADGMLAAVISTGVTQAISEKPRHRFGAAHS